MNSHDSRISGPFSLSRRALVGGAAAGGLAGLLAHQRRGLPGASAQASGQSVGDLRLALGFDFPARIDQLKDHQLLPMGMLECLTRQTPDNVLEPWLAESITNTDPSTWRVVLRDATFWDGSPVTADDVINSIRLSYDASPDNKGLISPDTVMTAVDAKTIDFVTPSPSGFFPHALALSSFGVFKLAADGTGSIMTGPYKPTRLVVDSQLDLVPHAGHWAGPPPIANITVTYVPDPNTRLLALQSGDVDMLYNFPAEAIDGFGPDIEAPIIPSGRVDLINLNVNRLPFSDRAVREAMALGIDRDELNTVGLNGHGTPAVGMFPPSTGYQTLPLQGTDPTRAAQLLDDAGWPMGSDGVRARDGARLSFTLYSYPGRAELTPYAVTMQSQLQPLGFDITVTEVQNVADVIKTGDWDAAMKSNNTIVTGDPLYEFNRLFLTGGGDNVGQYSNPQLDAIVDQMRTELDPAKEQDLSMQVQQIVKDDVPVVFLVALPITTAYRKGKVIGYVPNPNDGYLITTALSVKA
jgi:peptide/nickel transport system substrate-binding protein